ncbi:MAG: hypothetical protein K2I26_02625 [Paramuribaculum sp.]|nr:hypothetical protein [Paramuribaculum sp.]
MKKLVLLFAVVFGASIVSCNDAKKAETTADTTATETVDTTAATVDSTATVDSAAVVDSAKVDTTKAA